MFDSVRSVGRFGVLVPFVGFIGFFVDKKSADTLKRLS